MGNTDNNAEQAANQLAHLVDHFVTLPRRPPAGHRTTPVRSITNTAPLNVDTVSHIDATVREIRDYMAVESPGTREPLPKDAAAVYDWMIRNTEHSGDAVQRRRDTLIYRQYLEHAILTGDTNVVCRHLCPGCGCVGLLWHHPTGKALCTNRHCRTPDGRPNTWALQHLAHEHIEARERLAARRAT